MRLTLVILSSIAVVLVSAPAAWPDDASQQTRTRRYEGELTKVEEKSITVKPVRRGEGKAGIEWTVAVDEETKVVRSILVRNERKGASGQAARRYRTEPGKLSDLAVGQHVRVKADAERASEINILPPPQEQQRSR
jgi:hypothetical protein